MLVDHLGDGAAAAEGAVKDVVIDAVLAKQCSQARPVAGLDGGGEFSQ